MAAFDPEFELDANLKVHPSQMVDIDGKPIRYGKDPNDTETIGIDDSPQFEMRNFDDYPDVPMEAKKAEIQYIVPMANFLAQSLGINLIDEKMYEKVLGAVKSISLFVLINMAQLVVRNGVAEWFGLIITCKKQPIVLTKFKLQVSTGKIGITQIRFWNSSTLQYVVYGDKEQRKFLNREEVTAQILEYLKREGVCKV